MAKQTAKTRNPDRRNGKAWGKHHNLTVADVQQAQDRRAKQATRRAAREAKAVVHHSGGFSVTMPSFDWQWFGEVMRGIHTHTRRFRMVDACMAQERSKE